MKKCYPYILPILLCVAFGLNQMQILHVNFLKIKSHELKLTNLSYNFIPGGVYSGGETVSNNNYEDALIGIKPNYKRYLQQDLDLIAQNRERIDWIDNDQLYFHSNKFKVKLCLDHKKISRVDSSIFKHIVYLDILGQFEIWDKDETELLQSHPDRKWWIRDSIIFKGFATKEFYENKLTEIWMAQLTEPISKLVRNYAFTEEFDKWIALAMYYKTFERKISSNYRMDGNDLRRGIYRIIADKKTTNADLSGTMAAKPSE